MLDTPFPWVGLAFTDSTLFEVSLRRIYRQTLIIQTRGEAELYKAEPRERMTYAISNAVYTQHGRALCIDPHGGTQRVLYKNRNTANSISTLRFVEYYVAQSAVRAGQDNKTDLLRVTGHRTYVLAHRAKFTAH